MYATVHRVTGLPGPPDDSWVDDVLDAARAAGSPTGLLVSRAITFGDGHLVAFWSTQPEADAAAAATPAGGAVTVGPGSRFSVYRRRGGVAAGPARYLQLTSFDGPRTADWVQAFHRADEERIWPAVRDVPGSAGAVSLAADDGGHVVLVLSESVEAIEEGVRRLMSTELLPGEDPAYLTGPDRVDLQRLVHAELPAEVLS